MTALTQEKQLPFELIPYGLKRHKLRDSFDFFSLFTVVTRQIFCSGAFQEGFPRDEETSRENFSFHFLDRVDTSFDFLVRTDFIGRIFGEFLRRKIGARCSYQFVRVQIMMPNFVCNYVPAKMNTT